jgi:5-methylcytosine-specific restriction endonuclease McrA
MNLHRLTDKQLLELTKSLVSRERELLGEILRHLREVERRRLFSDLGCKSLFDYAVKELKYSEDQAYRRINAMRLIRELPEIEKSIEEGTLSLSTLGVASSLFKAEAKHNAPVAPAKKLEVLNALNGKSRREAEVVVQSFTSLPKEALRPERARVIDEHVELRLVAKKELQDKVDRVKGLIAHLHPQMSTAELLEKLCDDFLECHEKSISTRQSRRPNLLKSIPQSRLSDIKPAAPQSKEHNPPPAPPRNAALSVQRRNPRTPSRNIRHVPAHVKRNVWDQSEHQCQNCRSTHALQIDHIQPVAKGGSNEPDNLRLLCRSCNQRSAIREFGADKMQAYLGQYPRHPEMLR